MKKSFKCHAAGALMGLNVFPHPAEQREIPTLISYGVEREPQTGLIVDKWKYADGHIEITVSDVNFMPQSQGPALKLLTARKS